MPMINFNGVRRIYHGGRQIKQLYAGRQLVWKEPRIVTGQFFTYVTDAPSNKTNVVVDRLGFDRLNIRASDVAYYVGKSGKWYPISLKHENYSTQIDVPYADISETGFRSDHTLVLKDTD